MNYCVIKNTTTIIDGSENSEEIMLQNAESAGFTNINVEILTEEEYRTRVNDLPTPTPVPTVEERLASTEEMLTMLMGV